MIMFWKKSETQVLFIPDVKDWVLEGSWLYSISKCDILGNYGG